MPESVPVADAPPPRTPQTARPPSPRRRTSCPSSRGFNRRDGAGRASGCGQPAPDRIAIGVRCSGCGRAAAWNAANRPAAESAQADFVPFQPRFQPPGRGRSRVRLRTARSWPHRDRRPLLRLRTRNRLERGTPPGRRVRAGGLRALPAAVSTAETRPVVRSVPPTPPAPGPPPAPAAPTPASRGSVPCRGGSASATGAAGGAPPPRTATSAARAAATASAAPPPCGS